MRAISRFVVALTAAVASIAAPPAGAVSAMTPAAAARTSVLRVRPVDTDGTLAKGYKVTRSFSNATCLTGSDVSRGAWRCFAGNYVLDPCWAESGGTSPLAACPTGPWSKNVWRIVVPAGFQQSPPGGPRLPWGIELGSGARCVFADGASGVVRGRRINYLCPHDQVLIGTIGRAHEPWRIRTGSYGSLPDGQVTWGPVEPIEQVVVPLPSVYH